VSEPVRLGESLHETWLRVVEAAWARDGLVPSVEDPRPLSSGWLPFEIEEGS
jgi:hypothetical protein